jgi:hypothetical protein
MSLLVEFNIGGTTNYLSQEGLPFERYWDNRISTIDPLQYKLSSRHGGYVSMSYGSIGYFPDLFTSNWPPPTKGLTVAKNTNSTTSANGATTLFIGTSHISKLSRDEVRYNLMAESYSTTIASGVTLNTTLYEVFNNAATSMGLSLVSTLAANDTTPILFTTNREYLLIDLLDEVSKYHGHLFYIDTGTTINLVNMLSDNGVTTLTEYDFFITSNYEFDVVSSVKGGTSVFSSTTYPYGRELSQTPYHSVEANVTPALKKIAEIYNDKVQINLKIPFREPLPTTPGMRVQWTDTAQYADVSAYLRVRTVKYDYQNDEVTLIGEGMIQAG